MNEIISNNQARKLGDRLREANCDKKNISDIDMEYLQQLRISHKESLTEVFQVLSNQSKTVHAGRILSFRIKKIDTILSKLRRQPTMELDRMWDIAGCRCIVQSETAIYKIANLLKTRFEVKEKDRINTPAEDGYRALHLYVKTGENKSKTVEIQLRTYEQHYWSTLVEIIDLLYGTKIKEGDNSKPELNLFLKHYSTLKSLSLEDRLLLVSLENRFGIFTKMVSTFAKNIFQLRNEWVNIDLTDEKNCYVLFEVDTAKAVSTFAIYDEYEQAESQYYARFKVEGIDSFLSHIDSSDFRNLGIAYANYVLTSHNFLEVWKQFLFSLVSELCEQDQLSEAKTVYKNYDDILKFERDQYVDELLALLKMIISTKGVKNHKKLQSWYDEHKNKLSENEKLKQELLKKLGKKPDFSVIKFLQKLPKKLTGISDK